jgi:hypothetical protein
MGGDTPTTEIVGEAKAHGEWARRTKTIVVVERGVARCLRNRFDDGINDQRRWAA